MQTINQIFPKSFSMYVRNVTGFSRNTAKLQSINVFNANPGNIITWSMPQNALIDTRTIALHATGTCTAVGTSAYAAFPRNVDIALFDSCNVSSDSLTINMPSNFYNQVGMILMDMTSGYDSTNKRGPLQNSFGPVTNSTTGALAITASDTNVPIVVQHFLGFLGTLEPPILDSRICGNLMLSLTLASANILIANAASTSFTYTLSNIYFTCDCVELRGVYDSVIDEFLASGGTYCYCFRNWFTSTMSPPSVAQTTNFSLSTASLNRVLGWLTYGLNPIKLGTDFYDVISHQSPYFSRPAVATPTINGTSYTINMTDYGFIISNIPHPVYRPSPVEAYALFLNAAHQTQDSSSGPTPFLCGGSGYQCSSPTTPWLTSFWCAHVELEEGTDASRTISGMNSMGNTQFCSFSTTGVSTLTAGLLMCFVAWECSQVLQVWAGKQKNVII